LNEGELVNADGYTTLFNNATLGNGLEGYYKGKLATASTPPTTLNGFKRYVTDDPSNTRNAFFIGDDIVVNNKIDMPDPAKPWVFGYAVDACWTQPTNKPVHDPMADYPISTNCPEAWKIEVQDLGPGITVDGGTTKLQIDVYDWQGKDEAHPVLVECPELFDGTIGGTWESDGYGYSRYEVEVQNIKLPSTGNYPCLVRKEAQENDPVAKPWLDLTAYCVFRIRVGWTSGYPKDVTPSSWSDVTPYAASIEGHYAYLACGGGGLQILDISDPTNPVLINQVDTPGTGRRVAESAGYACVADGASGLQIIDVDPPESAHIVDSVDIPGAVDVAVSEGYAYVVAGTLEIVDIDPPESAYVVKSVDLVHTWMREVAVSGGYAYVGIDEDYETYELAIIDVDPPEEAHVVKTVYTGGFNVAQGIAVSNGYAFVTDVFAGLIVIDVDPPESAYVASTFDEAGGPLAVSGNYAYVCGGSSGLRIVDIEDPQSVYIASVVDLPPFGNWQVAASGGYVYASGMSAGLYIIDADPPESAYLANSLYASGDLMPRGLAASGGYAYVADEVTGFRVIDVDPPESAHTCKSIGIPAILDSVEVSGDYAYVTSSTGLQIINISPPESAFVACSVGTSGELLALSDGYAYVANADDGMKSTLQIVDIDPPESAYILDSLDTSVEAKGVAASGGYAYMSGFDQVMGAQSFKIFDVDPPESAHIIKSVAVLASGAVDVSGGYAFIAGEYYLEIIDIEPVESAYYVKWLHSPKLDSFVDVTVSGDYAYVVSYAHAALQIIDVQPPSSAYIVSTIGLPEDPSHVAVWGNYVYCTHDLFQFGGLRIIRTG
jgi:hypothetical protein